MWLGIPWRNRYGLALSVGVCAVVAAFLALVGFRTLDIPVNDFLSRHSFSTTNEGSNVLLVFAEPEELNEPYTRQQLLKTIGDLEPKCIAVIDDGRFANAGSVVSIGGGTQPVYIGSPITTYAPTHSHWGFSDLSLDEQVIVRNQHRYLTVDGQRVPSIETQIAEHVLLDLETLPKDIYGIRFQGGPNSLSNISARQVLAGDAIPELVRNKVVLIGNPKRFGEHTPTTNQTGRMSHLEIHGHALTSLLNGNYYREYEWYFSMPWVILVVLIYSQFVRQSKFKHYPWWIAVGMVAGLLICWVSLNWFSVRLSPAAIGLGVLLSTIAFFVQRSKVLQEAFEFWKISTLSTTSTTHDAWDDIKNAVFQTVYPKRMVCFELPQDKTHLELVSVFNCDESNIHERRRDILRAPYREPIEIENPVEVSEQSFFADTNQETDVEYVVPLMQDGEVLGLIVICLDRKSLKGWSDFPNFISRLGGKLSERLAAETGLKRQASRRLSRLETLPEQTFADSIRQQERGASAERQNWLSAFEQVDSALAIYDPFGKLVQFNGKMIECLERHELVESETSCLDLVATLSGQKKNEARKSIRAVLFQKKNLQFHVVDPKDPTAGYIVNLKPLTNRNKRLQQEYSCILVEVVDQSAFQLLGSWNGESTEVVCEQTRSRLTELAEKVSNVSQNPDADSDSDLQELIGLVQETVGEVNTALAQHRHVAGRAPSHQPENCLPLETRAVFDSALAKVKKQFEVREIQLDYVDVDPQLIGVGNPFLLERVFIAIFEILLHNGFDQSTVSISAEQVDQKVCYSFQSRGQQSPIEGLRKSLSVESADVGESEIRGISEAYVDQLGEIRQWIECWNGKLQIVSRVDYGVSIELTLVSDQQGIQTTPLSTSDVLSSLSSKAPNKAGDV